MFIPRRSTTASSRKFAGGSRRTYPLPSGSSCIEEVTYEPSGRYAVNQPVADKAQGAGEGAATGAAAAEVVAPPPPTPHLNLNNKPPSRAAVSDADYRREVRIAGAPAAAEAAVARYSAGSSKLAELRRKYKAECAFGKDKCQYWEIHARGIEWPCREDQQPLP